MDLTALQTRLRSMVGSPSATDVPDAELTQHLNDAYRDIATKFPHHKIRKVCDFETTVGEDTYGLPTGVLSVLKVWDISNNVKLERVGIDQIARLPEQTDGKPLKYIRLRDYIQLVPPTDAVYSIRVHYITDTTDLTSGSDVPVVPTPWHIAIALLGKWYYYNHHNQVPKAQAAMVAYREWLRDKPSEMDAETVDIDSGVRLPTLARSSTKGLTFELAE
jgi:hypothetical protein